MENTTNTQFHNKLGMAFYHLDPRWISQKDFDNVADLGVVNSYRIAMESTGTLAYACKRAKKSGAQIWLAAPIFYSKRESLEEYMAGIDKYVEFLKKNDYWDTVVGFQWDEPLLKRAHTNADFYAMTGAISKAYGKRIFPVFSMQELLGFKGNPEDPDGIRSVHPEDTEFITDVAFDVYGYDFRLPPSERFVSYFRELSGKFGVELKSTIDVYTYYTKRMLEIVTNPDVRVWYFPCTYLAPLLGGKVADEDYCIAHIEGLKKMLLEQKNPGGLFCYGYKSWGNRDHLDWWLHPENPQRWDRFIKVCQDACSELSQIDLKSLTEKPMENTTEIVVNNKYHNKLSVILEGLDPRYCHLYEFKKAAALGVNCGYCAIQQHGTVTVVNTARHAQETGEPVWVIAPIFRRCNQTLEQYMTLLDKKIKPLKDTYQVWDNVVGLSFELPMSVEGFTGEDLLDMTRVFSETYGKRIMVSFTPQEILNPSFTKEQAKYITDAYVKCNKYEFDKPLSEEIDGKKFENAEDIYAYYTEKMKALIPDVHVWYNPFADVNAGQDAAIKSLEGFKELLLKEKKAGGLYVDAYKSYIDRDKLDWLLDAENPERWNKYIEVAKKVCNELRAIDVK